MFNFLLFRIQIEKIRSLWCFKSSPAHRSFCCLKPVSILVLCSFQNRSSSAEKPYLFLKVLLAPCANRSWHIWCQSYKTLFSCHWQANVEKVFISCKIFQHSLTFGANSKISLVGHLKGLTLWPCFTLKDHIRLQIFVRDKHPIIFCKSAQWLR